MNQNPYILINFLLSITNGMLALLCLPLFFRKLAWFGRLGFLLLGSGCVTAIISMFDKIYPSPTPWQVLSQTGLFLILIQVVFGTKSAEECEIEKKEEESKFQRFAFGHYFSTQGIFSDRKHSE